MSSFFVSYSVLSSVVTKENRRRLSNMKHYHTTRHKKHIITNCRGEWISALLRAWVFSNMAKCNSRSRIMQLPKSHSTIIKKHSSQSFELLSTRVSLLPYSRWIDWALSPDKNRSYRGEKDNEVERRVRLGKREVNEREHCQGHCSPSERSSLRE